jgi:hypothetical protein
MKQSLLLAAVLTLAAVVAIVLAASLVLRMPGIPYNVRELFLDQASLSALVFFALTLLWLGAGAMLLAYIVRYRGQAYLLVPLALIGASLVSKMLLSRSVTYESIDDIIGSNNLFALVTHEQVWGPAWTHLFQALGADVVDFVERRVRYTALYSIALLGITLSLAPAARSPHAPPPMRALDKFLLMVCIAAWLWLARSIVITWAATDNLTELLARRPVFGISGEWFLFAIPALIGVTVLLLIRATAQPTWWPVAIGSTIAALPVGWALLKLGLEPHVEKYGDTFSGAQFLLGPDRKNILSESALFARWVAVQLGGVSVTFIGAWVAQQVVLAASRGQAPTSGRREAADAVASRPRDPQDRV